MVGLLYWVSAPYRMDLQLNQKAKTYRDLLAEKIRTAQSVEMVEHSWFYESQREGGSPSFDSDIEEHSRNRLDSGRQHELALNVGRCPIAAKKTFSLGLFDPQFSLVIVEKDGKTSRLLIDFSSSQMEWYNTTGQSWELFDFVEPDALIDVFRDLAMVGTQRRHPTKAIDTGTTYNERPPPVRFSHVARWPSKSLRTPNRSMRLSPIECAPHPVPPLGNQIGVSHNKLTSAHLTTNDSPPVRSSHVARCRPKSLRTPNRPLRLSPIECAPHPVPPLGNQIGVSHNRLTSAHLTTNDSPPVRSSHVARCRPKSLRSPKPTLAALAD